MSHLKDQFYWCEICGNVVLMTVVGGWELVCCGENMIIMESKWLSQEGQEKHVPVLSIDGQKVTVKIGENPHPMSPEHYIELVQLLKKDKIIAEKRLFPNEEPVVVFCEIKETTDLKARIYCNIHGLWI